MPASAPALRILPRCVLFMLGPQDFHGKIKLAMPKAAVLDVSMRRRGLGPKLNLKWAVLFFMQSARANKQRKRLKLVPKRATECLEAVHFFELRFTHDH